MFHVTFSKMISPVVTLPSPHDGGGITSLGMNESGDLLCCSSDDNTASIWDVRAPASPCGILAGHRETVNFVSFLSSDSNYIFTSSDDRTVRLWDRRRQATIRAWRGFADGVNCCRVNNNGRTLVSACDDGLVYCHEFGGGTTFTLSDACDRFMAAPQTVNDLIVTTLQGGTEVIITASEEGGVRSWLASSSEGRATSGVPDHFDVPGEATEGDVDEAGAAATDRLISSFDEINRPVNHILRFDSMLFCAAAEAVFCIPWNKSRGIVADVSAYADDPAGAPEAMALVGHTDFIRGLACLEIMSASLRSPTTII